MGEQDQHLPVDAPDPAALSALLGGYDVQELVACGGMGAVYRGRQVSLDRDVAIKVLPRELAEDEAFRSSFTAEARAMAKLAHPNLISVYDFGEVDGMFYLVMEFVEGDSLYAACHDQMVDPQQAVEIVQAVAAGLGTAHDEGIIHRDIKPANILIGQDLVPKLGDFGLAVPSDDVGSGMAMGTPGFVAPEVMENSETASPASDVFALGAMLHQMLSGITPTGEFEADMNLVPAAHGLRGVVQKSMSAEVSSRYRDGKEMAEALEGWLRRAKSGVAQVQVAGGVAGGGQWGKAVPVARTPTVSSASGGGGGKVFVMILLLAGLAGGGWWVMKGKGDDPAPGPVVEDPRVKDDDAGKEKPVVNEEPEEKEDDGEMKPEQPTMAELQRKYKGLLDEAQDDFFAARLDNVAALEGEVSDRAHWAAYLRLIDRRTGHLPRYWTAEEGLEFREGDDDILRRYVLDSQRQIDVTHRKTIQDLHADFVDEAKEAGLHLNQWTSSFWVGWLEGMNVSTMDMMGVELVGEWVRGGPQEEGPRLALKIERSGKVTIRTGEMEVWGTDLLETSETGVMTLVADPQERTKVLEVRWRDGRLACKDERGREFRLQPKPFKLLERARGEVGAVAEGGSPSGGVELKDPELVELKSKFLSAVDRRVGPVVALYEGKLNDGLKLATRRNDVRGLELIGEELARVGGLDWEAGLVKMDEVNWETLVPLSLQGAKSTFDRDFQEKMGTLQEAYIGQLKVKQQEFGRAGKDVREIESELRRLTTPEGTVRLRYLKLQAERHHASTFVSVAELTVLDHDKRPIPQEKLTIFDVSSERNGPDYFLLAKHAIDGDRDSMWHSDWSDLGPAEFPHWIAVDLQEERYVRGFRVLPRQDGMTERSILKWTLFASRDGKDWKEVAKGAFEESAAEKEYLFEE